MLSEFNRSFSYKNALQEYCQKSKLPLPRYETNKVECGDGNSYMWMTTLYISEELRVEPIRGGIEKTKVEAEQSAARLALQFLDVKEAAIPKLVVLRSTAILIDGENCPRAYESLLRELGDGYTIYTFASAGHPALSRTNRGSSDLLIAVPSSRKDAVDISMSIHLGMYIAQGSFSRYIIITKDHFGACIPECVDEQFKNAAGYFSDYTPVEVSHYQSPADFLTRERCLGNNK